MRTKMRRNSKLFATLSLFLSASAFLTVFQNCGSFDLGATNPLYDSSIRSQCLGINCTRDLNTVKIRAGYSAYSIENSASGVDTTSCNGDAHSASQCIDVGGYCEAGGYVDSVFYYQWILVNSTGAETRTTTRCDENGRFHMQVHLPTGYTYTAINHLRIFMKVIDETGAQFTSPTGSGEFIYQVSTRVGS